MVLYHRQNQCRGYDEQKEKHLRYCWSVNCISIRTNTLVTVEVLSSFLLCPLKLVWRLKTESSSIPALKSGCNILDLSYTIPRFPVHLFFLVLVFLNYKQKLNCVKTLKLKVEKKIVASGGIDQAT
jgi:hypothetical protein